MRITVEWTSDGLPLVDAWNVVRGILPALIAMFVLLLVTGCAAPEVRWKTVTVEVPVPVPCVVDAPPEPAWEVDQLTADANDFRVAQAYRAEREQRKQYVRELKAAQQGCKPQGGKP